MTDYVNSILARQIVALRGERAEAGARRHRLAQDARLHAAARKSARRTQRDTTE